MVIALSTVAISFTTEVPWAHARCAVQDLEPWWQCGREPPEREDTSVPIRGIHGCASAWTNRFYSEDVPESRSGLVTNWWNLHDINFRLENTVNFVTEFTWKEFDHLIKLFNDFTGDRSKNDLSPELIFSPISPMGNNFVQVIAKNQIHDQDSKFHHYAWSIDGVTQQGFVAGGLPIDPADIALLESRDSRGNRTSKVIIPTITSGGSVDLPSVNYLEGANTTCRFAHRAPRVDTDADGMDDDWERRYFPEATVLSDVRPLDDPDQDGYLNKDFVNQNNVDKALRADLPIPAEYIRIVPDTTAALIQTDTGFWIPDRTGSTTGDGKYTNREEFIWGTNPNDPDSDDDGFPDEADITGLGQGQMAFRTPPTFKEPERLKIETVAMGKSRIHNRYGNALTDMFPIDQYLYASAGLDFDVQLHVTPELLYVTRETTIDAIADVTNTNHRPGNFDYYWTIKKANGDATFTILASGDARDPGKKIVSGNANYPFRGLSHITWTLTKEMALAENITANSLLVLSVDVVDPITHRLKRSEFNIRTTDEVFIDVESFNEIGCPIRSPDQYQAGGKVRFTASALSSLQDDDALLFVWYIDGVEQRNQEFSSSGVASITLPLMRKLLLGQGHTVGVRVYSRHTGRIVGYTEKTIAITQLSAQMLTGEAPPVLQAPRPDQCPRYEQAI